METYRPGHFHHVDTRNVRGSKNPFVIIGRDGPTSGRYKCTPASTTKFKAGDVVHYFVDYCGGVKVGPTAELKDAEDWKLGNAWGGI